MPGCASAWAQHEETTENRAQPNSSRAGRSLKIAGTWTFRIRTPRAALFRRHGRATRGDRHGAPRRRKRTCLRRPPQRQLPVHQAGIRACECRCSVTLHRSHRRLPRFITQWLQCRSLLANRCGGSAGMGGKADFPAAPASRLTAPSERERAAPGASGTSLAQHRTRSACVRTRSVRGEARLYTHAFTPLHLSRGAPPHRGNVLQT